MLCHCEGTIKLGEIGPLGSAAASKMSMDSAQHTCTLHADLQDIQAIRAECTGFSCSSDDRH